MDMKTSPLALLKDPSLLKTDGLINGEWVKGGGRFDVHDPATGLKLADVANLGPADAEKAITAANAAWAGWRTTSKGWAVLRSSRSAVVPSNRCGKGVLPRAPMTTHAACRSLATCSTARTG